MVILCIVYDWIILSFTHYVWYMDKIELLVSRGDTMLVLVGVWGSITMARHCKKYAITSTALKIIKVIKLKVLT